jgi:hypothetical protein
LLKRYPKVEKQIKDISRMREKKIAESLEKVSMFLNIGSKSEFW